MKSAIKTIGWVGTGVMGSSMCKHIIKAGYNLKVCDFIYQSNTKIYTRTQSKA